MKKIGKRSMKRCPKCHVDNAGAAVKCKKCRYEFEDKVKLNNWPSDEWKDWNLK